MEEYTGVRSEGHERLDIVSVTWVSRREDFLGIAGAGGGSWLKNLWNLDSSGDWTSTRGNSGVGLSVLRGEEVRGVRGVGSRAMSCWICFLC